MNHTEGSLPTSLHESNGNSETQRQAVIIRDLQAQCAELRERLTLAEKQRDGYLSAIYAYERESILAQNPEEFELEWLIKNSADPVELLAAE